jgi:hypothetical protein
LNLVGVVCGIVFDFVFFTFIIGGMRVGVSVPLTASIVQQTIIALVGFFAIIFALAIVGAVFYMRAFNNLADKSGVKGFRDAGLILLIGYALTIILVGALLVWVAWILATSAFFSLKPKTSISPYSQPTPVHPVQFLQREISSISTSTKQLKHEMNATMPHSTLTINVSTSVPTKVCYPSRSRIPAI